MTLRASPSRPLTHASSHASGGSDEITPADIGAVATAELGAAGGVATLDGSGKIPQAQVPAIAIVDTYVAASEAAMLGLAAEVGDVAVRTDESKSYILAGDDPSNLADWQELLSPTGAVQSVFGRTGTVTAEAGDYAVADITGLQDALDAKADVGEAGGAPGNLWDPPASPHADDDEFDADSSADWTISGNAATVEAGDPDPTVTVTTNKHRRSFGTVRRGWLLLQPDHNSGGVGAVQYGKAHAFATNEVVWARFVFNTRATGAAGSDPLIGIYVGATSAGAFDGANSIRLTINSDTGGLTQVALTRVEGGSTTPAASVAYGVTGLPSRIEYLALRKAGSTWYAYAAGADQSWIPIGSTGYAGTAVDRIMLDVRNKFAPHLVVGFDFVRFATALP